MLVCKQAHVRECHSWEQAPGAGRCGRNPHSRGRQRLVPSFPHGDGDENFWKATNSPQSHKAEDQSYLDGGGERQAGAAGEGEKGSAHQLKDFTLREGEGWGGLRNSTPLSLRVWKKPTHIKGKINSDKLLRRLV